MFVQDGFLYLIVTRHKLTVWLSLLTVAMWELLLTHLNYYLPPRVLDGARGRRQYLYINV